MNAIDGTIHAVANILATSVLIDERLRDIEIIEFSHSMTTINQHVRPDVILPPEDIAEWFKGHADSISNKISTDENDVWKTQILNQIQDQDLRRMVLTAMFSISVCDYELKDEECEFLKLAVSLWKIDLPHVTDMERMVG